MSAYHPDAGLAFCHLPKCAGWTVKEYLARALPGLHVARSPEYDDMDVDVTFDADIPRGHLAVRDWEKYVGTDPRDYEMVLATVRDPYEREVSQWLYFKDLYFQKRKAGQRPMTQHHGAANYGWGTVRTPREAFVLWLKEDWGYYHVSHEYHETRPPVRTGAKYEHFGGFLRYWVGLDDEIPDNVTLVRAEHLDTELPKVLAPYVDEVPEIVPRNNEGPDREPVESYLSDEACEIIERRYPVLTSEDWYGTRRADGRAADGRSRGAEKARARAGA